METFENSRGFIVEFGKRTRKAQRVIEHDSLAPAVEDALKMVGKIYKDAGFTDADINNIGGRELGEAVAEAMLELSRRVGFPTKLSEVEGFTQAHIDKALEAAKNPQLKMKLQNMRIPLDPSLIDEYMGPILEAAKDGDISKIKNLRS